MGGQIYLFSRFFDSIVRIVTTENLVQKLCLFHVLGLLLLHYIWLLLLFVLLHSSQTVVSLIVFGAFIDALQNAEPDHKVKIERQKQILDTNHNRSKHMRPLCLCRPIPFVGGRYYRKVVVTRNPLNNIDF